MWECYPHVHGQGMCKADPYVQKFRIHLLRKTLVSKIDQKNDPLSMDPEQRATPISILMSWIQWIQHLVDLSNDHYFITRWIPPLTGFHGHLLNPYSRHRMEIVHQNRILVSHARIFIHFPCGNTSHTIHHRAICKFDPMCINFTFTYWAKP